MKSRSQTRIKLDWLQDAPFRVRLNRVIPQARRAPDAYADFFMPTGEEAWRAPAFLV